jgi:hypothetical protein
MGNGVNVGSKINVYQCVHGAANEIFSLDAQNGQLVDSNSKMCVVTTGCTGPDAICLGKCDSKATAWSKKADGSLRTGNDCLQVDVKASKSGDNSVSIGPCSSPLTMQQQWNMVAATPTHSGQCLHKLNTTNACFDGARLVAGLTNTTFTPQTVNDATTPPGCTIAVSEDTKTAVVTYNTNTASPVCCNAGDEVIGTAYSLVTLVLGLNTATRTVRDRVLLMLTSAGVLLSRYDLEEWVYCYVSSHLVPTVLCVCQSHLVVAISHFSS